MEHLMTPIETVKQLDISTYHRDCLTLLKLIQQTIHTTTDESDPAYLTDGEIIDTIVDLLSAANLDSA